MAEKDFARQRLAEMGAVGVTSIEEKTNNLEAQVAAGDTVVVGGQAVKVSELMSDPKLKATIATALESDDELAKLEKTDKDLASWIRNNKAALVPVRNELLKGTEAFAANNKVFADNIADLATTHKTLLDKTIPGWNNAKDMNWTEWVGSPASGETPAKGLYATAPTMAHVLTMTDKAKRGVALSALSKLPTEDAKKFSTAFLDQIVAAAKDDTEAGQLMESFLATEDKDWIASINPMAGVKLDPAPLFDADYTRADYDKAVGEIVKSFAPNFDSLQSLVDKINALRTGGPKDREEAKRLSGLLSDIKGQINRTINKDTIDKVRSDNKTTKEKNSYLEVVKVADDNFNKVIQAIKGRGDHLGRRGAEVFAEIKSAMTSLRAQAAEGSISYPDALNKMKEIQTNMAGQLAAFYFDDNHRSKNPDASMDAIQLLQDSGISTYLSPSDRSKLKNLLSGTENFYREVAKKASGNTSRLTGWADRASTLNDRL
jgi:hypothetical protein